MPPLIFFRPTIETEDYCLGKMENTSARAQPAEPYCLAHPEIWEHVADVLVYSLPQVQAMPRAPGCGIRRFNLHAEMPPRLKR